MLQSEILDLNASITDKATGVVIESKIDKGKGPVSTVLVSNGTLKKGDFFVCGKTWGKIRAMIDHEGKFVDEAYPSMPVEILGMNDIAFSGAEFQVTENENQAKEISEFKKDSTPQNKINLNEKQTIFDTAEKKDELNVILKSDVHGCLLYTSPSPRDH